MILGIWGGALLFGRPLYPFSGLIKVLIWAISGKVFCSCVTPLLACCILNATSPFSAQHEWCQDAILCSFCVGIENFIFFCLPARNRNETQRLPNLLYYNWVMDTKRMHQSQPQVVLPVLELFIQNTDFWQVHTFFASNGDFFVLLLLLVDSAGQKEGVFFLGTCPSTTTHPRMGPNTSIKNDQKWRTWVKRASK